jgi:hypothetical protein
VIVVALLLTPVVVGLLAFVVEAVPGVVSHWRERYQRRPVAPA